MATVVRTFGHPKHPKCVFCHRWMADKDVHLEFKNSVTGFQYDSNVYGTCMRTNSRTMSNTGDLCKYYIPSVEASKIL